jgi:hypothetical protein
MIDEAIDELRDVEHLCGDWRARGESRDLVSPPPPESLTDETRASGDAPASRSLRWNASRSKRR